MIVVGVDAGGSRTQAAVWRDGSKVITARGPGAAIRPGRALQSSATIASVAKSALAQANLTRADVLVVGAAGAGRASEAEELRSALRGEYIAERVIVTTDVALAMETVDNAIVLLAGTGSIAVARLENGETVQRGGHGWQIGDEGSGYWIAREALGAASRAQDGRGDKTSLVTALQSATASPTFRDLAAWASTATPREMAALAPVVSREAGSGDAVASGILDRAATELADLVSSIGANGGVVMLGGGVLEAGGLLNERLRKTLEERGFTVGPELIQPIEGALALANKSG